MKAIQKTREKPNPYIRPTPSSTTRPEQRITRPAVAQQTAPATAQRSQTPATAQQAQSPSTALVQRQTELDYITKLEILAMKLKDVNWEDRKRNASIHTDYTSMIEALNILIRMN